MSLTYQPGGGLWRGMAWTGLALAVSAGLHAAPVARMLAQPPATEPPAQAQAGATGAILFDLSDIITAPSDAGEDSAEVAESVSAPTVTESAEAVDPAKAADEPPLQQIPYEVEDDELKFGVASPDPVEEVEETAHEAATEYDEEKVDAETQMGAEDRAASQASVSGVSADQTSDTAQAQDEGLTAEQMAQVTEWQKDIVVRISKAKRYPKLARSRRIEGEVLVRFTVDRYGAVLARTLEQSSGWPVLDQAALEVFDEIGKLPTPPNHLEGAEFTLMVPLRYSFK
ncbi:protein TonB [Sagittula marina]|uniref:Protein TonB n=1 Tax=Sagittula marina TaxID=943940 RepID=A0A7W6DJ39_9RHOB|nr:TonB family protein [Sagittula marina]MBB3983963.1 protein TonB [Sagittula marina]